MSKRSANPGARSNRLESFLVKHRKIGIDTAVFIYQLEENPKYVELTQRIFARSTISGRLMQFRPQQH